MDNRGFTIVEVAICLALLVVVALAMVYVVTENSYVEQANKEKILALNYARKMLEDVKSHPYEEIRQSNFPVHFDVSENNIELEPLAGASCGTLSISGEDAEGVKTIFVSIEWQTVRGMPLSVQLETSVTDH